MGIESYAVRRDKFEPEDSRFAFPCCVCIHRFGTDHEEPCRTCDHNANAVQDEEDGRHD